MVKILETDKLDIGYCDERNCNTSLVHNISIDANRGELIALIGQNGSGKSTLLRTLVGLQKAVKGSVLINQQDIRSWNNVERAKQISFVSTEAIYAANLNVFELISLGRFPYTNWLGNLKQEDIDIINDAIAKVGLQKLVKKSIAKISDGEKQRAVIARALVQDTELIILDEPTAFLDLPNKYELVALLANLCKKNNKTIVFSTHDLNIALRYSDKIWLMINDSIEQGAPEDLVLNSSFEKIFNHSNILFDRETGDFNLPKKYITTIGLFGEGIYFYWTQKALERIGILAEQNQSHTINIKIDTIGNIAKWQIHHNQQTTICNSIYELCGCVFKYM